MAEDKKGGAFNGGFSTSLRNILMIISLASALAIGIAAVQSRASKSEMDGIKDRVRETEIRGDYRDEKLDDIEIKIDWLIKHQK